MSKTFWVWTLALLLTLTVGWRLYAKTPQVSPQEQIERQMAMIQGNSLITVSSPVIPQTQVLGSIISCESGGDPLAKNANSTALGLCQFINSTWEYVQLKWDIELDRLDYHDQLYACDRLLREEGPDKHWAESKPCWDK